MIKIEQLQNVTTKAVDEMNKLMKQLSDLQPQLTYASLLEVVKDPASTLLVVREGTEIIGTGTLIAFHTLGGHHGKLEDLVVDENHRGQGLGEQLTAKLIALAKEKRISRLELTSRPHREAANKLYQKLGFQKRETNVYRLSLSPSQPPPYGKGEAKEGDREV